MGIELVRDDNGVRAQIAHHKTDAQDATETGLSVFPLDGSSAADTSAAFAFNTPVKVSATDADIWIKVGAAPTAVSGEGEFIGIGSYDHMAVKADEKISVIGGIANIVPLKD
jgi:hypothetical protein